MWRWGAGICCSASPATTGAKRSPPISICSAPPHWADDVDVRRSRALGLLALLLRHTDPTTYPTAETDASDGESAEEEPAEEEPPAEVEVTGLERLLAEPASAAAFVKRAATPAPRIVRHDLHVTLRPVAVPGDAVPADSYEIPERIREAVRWRHPTEIFPYGQIESRHLDQDHTLSDMSQPPPPPQDPRTHPGPPTRTGRPSVAYPARLRLPVTNTGTHDLGDDATAQRLWDAADPDGKAKVEAAA